MNSSPIAGARSWVRRLLSLTLVVTGGGFAFLTTMTQTAYASCDGDQQITVTATAGNTSGYITTIDNGEINGISVAVPIVSQLWPSQYDSHPLGVWYNTSAAKWTIFNEDLAAIPLGTSFTVGRGCLGAGGRTLARFTAAAGNVSGDAMFIDDPVTNGNPNAVIYATQDWTGTYNAHEIGVYYNIVYAKWAVYNLDLSAMPVGATFDVWAGSNATSPSTLSVSANASNTVGGYMVYLNDARFNNQPGLEPAVSQVYYMGPCTKFGCPGVINDHPIGVWYDASVGKWVIYNVDRANMPAGASFLISAQV